MLPPTCPRAAVVPHCCCSPAPWWPANGSASLALSQTCRKSSHFNQNFQNQGNVIKYVRVGGISGEGYFNNVDEFYQHSTTNLIISFQQQLDSLSWFPGWLLYPVFTQPNIQIQIAVNVISISSTEQEKLLCPNFRFTL